MPKVSALPPASLPLAGTEVVYLVQGGNSRQATVDDVRGPAASNIQLQTAVAAAGQTSIPLTGIPSWANRATLTFVGFSTSGASNVLVQLGTSSGAESSGYLGTAAVIGSGAVGTAIQLSSGFVFSNGTAAAGTNIRHGKIVIERQSGDTWACEGSLSLSELLLIAHTAGTKALSAPLTQVFVTTVNGTDTFDAGSVAMSWE